MDFLDFVVVSLNLFILFCFCSLSFIIGFTMGTKRTKEDDYETEEELTKKCE